MKCYGGTGSAEAQVEGGTTPYSYLWSPSSSPSSNATIDEVLPGDYILEVTDNNGCQKSSSFEITQPRGIIII